MLAPLLLIVLQCQHPGPSDPKTYGTFQSRILFYFKFVLEYGLTDDFGLINVSHERRIFQFSMYAAWIGTGHTMKAIPSIASGTIGDYLL